MTAHERITAALREHRINYHHRNVGPEPVTADNLRYTSCEGCDWLGGCRDEAGWEAHLADVILAALGAETREETMTLWRTTSRTRTVTTFPPIVGEWRQV